MASYNLKLKFKIENEVVCFYISFIFLIPDLGNYCNKLFLRELESNTVKNPNIFWNAKRQLEN